jgi:dolichol-phosphate mannosyltransferase
VTDPTARILVVIPTFNEADNLLRIVPLVLNQDPRIDVLVVDDNSPDGTGDLADDLAEELDRVHVLHRSGKQGLGRAYLEGFEWGLDRAYGLFIEMDADFSHDPDALPEFIEKAREFDVVLGSRYVEGRVTVINWPMSRLLISYFGSRYARIVTGLPVRDATGGFNCWRREVLAALDFDRIESNGYTFQIELKLRAWRRGFSLTEIPIIFAERDSGESKMSKRIVFEAVWKVWKLRLLHMFGRL